FRTRGRPLAQVRGCDPLAEGAAARHRYPQSRTDGGDRPGAAAGTAFGTRLRGLPGVLSAGGLSALYRRHAGVLAPADRRGEPGRSDRRRRGAGHRGGCLTSPVAGRRGAHPADRQAASSNGRNLASAASLERSKRTSGGLTPLTNKSRRTSREAPDTPIFTPRRRIFCARPSIVFAAVESMNGTADRSSTR